MAITLLPNISRNLPCDAATLQGLLDNATHLLEHQQKGVNEVWATNHTPPFLRWGGFLKFEGSNSVSFADKYRLHPREEFTLIFQNFTREHIDGGFWLCLGQTTSSAVLSISMEEDFATNPGEILFKMSDGSVTISAVSFGLDLRHHDIVELGVVYDGTDISFFADGVLVNTVTGAASPLNYVGQMYIGGDHAGSNEITGYLRDWNFWGKSFSSGEMATYFGNHVDPYVDELRISLAFDEAAGTVISDSADATKWGIEFDDNTSTPVYHQEELICIDDFTILGEAYWHENSDTENVIIAKGSEFEGHCNYRVAVEKATKKIKFSSYDGVSWNHVVSDLLVRAGHYFDWGVRVSDGSIDFYIDGIWDTKVISVDLRSDYYSLVFGYDRSLLSPLNRWHGHLRDIGIFPAVLTDEDVANYFAGSIPSSVTSYWTLRNGVSNTFESTIEHNANDFTSLTVATISHNVMQQTPVEGTWLVSLFVTDLAAISSIKDIFRKGASSTYDFMLYVDGSKQLVFQMRDPNINTVTTSHTVSQDRVYEVFITVKRNVVRVLMNGSVYSTIITDSVRNPSVADLIIGIVSAGSFPGYIWGYKQWDRCLRSDEEDKMLYERIFPTSGLVVDCPMNEGSGTTFQDKASEYRLDI